MSLQVTQALHQLLGGVQRPSPSSLTAQPGIIKARTLAPQLPNYSALLQNAPSSQLQPQQHFSQTQPQVGVTSWDLGYLANPNRNQQPWHPVFNPADFKWNGQLRPLPPLDRSFAPTNHQSLFARIRNIL